MRRVEAWSASTHLHFGTARKDAQVQYIFLAEVVPAFEGQLCFAEVTLLDVEEALPREPGSPGLVNRAAAARRWFFQYPLLRQPRDAKFPDQIVGSVDADLACGSNGTKRWNYTSINAPKAFATGDPGPALSSEKGAVYAINFKMYVYCIDDVHAGAPRTGADTGAAKQCIYWDYSVVVVAAGSFTHPAF